MYAAAGRCRRGADKEPVNGRSVRRATEHRPSDNLTKISRAAVDVSAGVVRIVAFHPSGSNRVTSHDAVTESGGESVDLVFDALGHVCRATVRDMTVSPCRMHS